MVLVSQVKPTPGKRISINERNAYGCVLHNDLDKIKTHLYASQNIGVIFGHINLRFIVNTRNIAWKRVYDDVYEVPVGIIDLFLRPLLHFILFYFQFFKEYLLYGKEFPRISFCVR